MYYEIIVERLHATVNGQDEARLDLNIGGFWQRGQQALVDVKVFNPFARTYGNRAHQRAFKQ